MQRQVLLPLRRVAQSPAPSSRFFRPHFYSTSPRPQTPRYQCISPLARRQIAPSLRRIHPQWQASRTVYTQKGTTLWQRATDLQRSNPITFPLSLLCIAAAIGMGFVALHYYMNVIVPIESIYPEEVSVKLKRALYYTHQDPNPAKAWDYYLQALKLCEELKVHPFSPEVIGLRLWMMKLLEDSHNYKSAVRVLEHIRDDCLKFVAWCEASEQEDLKVHRTRVLEKCVQMSVKLGELYSGTYTRDDEKAEKVLIEGLEILLKESHRRKEENVKDEDEGPWMPMEEITGSLEALADTYEKQSKHYLAAPLYLRAIMLAQPPSCHTAVLMNNLAASLAQTSPERPPASSDPRNDPPTSRPALISNARQWTEKSIEICQSIRPPARTEECDIGCVVATHNLGEFAEMEGMIEEARKRYAEAQNLSKAIKFWEGADQAKEALQRLDKAA